MNHQNQQEPTSLLTRLMKLPGITFFSGLKLSVKLAVAFGALVVVTIYIVAMNYTASQHVTTTIDRTADLRVPVALASSSARTNLLRMGAVGRAYLLLGTPQLLEAYHGVGQNFQNDLERLDELSENFDQENRQRLEELKTAAGELRQLSDKTFGLRGDQMKREPAYHLMNTRGTELGGKILLAINQMIREQAKQEPSLENNALIADMAEFQSSFAGMLAGLRGYVASGDPNFWEDEYQTHLQHNETIWDNLLRQRNQFDTAQARRLDEITTLREQFFAEIPDQVFETMNSPHWREDLYVLQTEVVPLAERMVQLLQEMSEGQQTTMVSDLNQGRDQLNAAVNQNILWGSLAVLVSIFMALAFGRAINQIVRQMSKEKQRADNLLDVVIPLGVQLSSEKNFQHLLESMLKEAMTFCRADGGSLFLCEEQTLKYVLIRNISKNLVMGGTSTTPVSFAPLPLCDEKTDSCEYSHIAAYAASKGETVNIATTYADSRFSFMGVREFDTLFDYTTHSLLAIPLKNSQGKVLGVLELVNAQNPDDRTIISFDTNLQQMVESFSLLAVAALESYIREQALRQEIKELRIEIDEVRQKKQVSEIVETDFFQDLRSKARSLRNRSREPGTGGGESPIGGG